MSPSLAPSTAGHSSTATGPDVSAAFSAGWLVAQLHGPIPDKKASASSPLPTVNELGRADRLRLTLDEFDALLAQPLAAAVAASPPEQLLTTTRLHILARAEHFDANGFRQAIVELHTILLTRLTVADRRLGSAYMLGRSLSDTCWLVTDAESFTSMFGKYRLANLQSWLTDLTAGLPPESAKAVSQGMDHWAAWLQVNEAMDWQRYGVTVQNAARAQGERWRGLLAGDKNPKGFLSANAYIEAGDAALRRAGAIGRLVFARLWWALAIIAIATAGALFIALRYSSGTAKVWTSLASVVAGLGVTAKSAQATSKRMASNATGSLLNVAEEDAIAWGVTVLPDVPLRSVQRRQLRKLGVGPPQKKLRSHAPRGRQSSAAPPAPQPPAGSAGGPV